MFQTSNGHDLHGTEGLLFIFGSSVDNASGSIPWNIRTIDYRIPSYRPPNWLVCRFTLFINQFEDPSHAIISVGSLVALQPSWMKGEVCTACWFVPQNLP